MTLEKVYTYQCLGMKLPLYMCLKKLTPSGQPTAWCITNYETTQVVELYLNQIKSRSPTATVTVLMSDDGLYIVHCTYVHAQKCSLNVICTFSDDVFCSAAKTVYGNTIKHILYRWYVDR